MPEPLTLIAIGAAIGGAAGKFVEKAWDSGEKWVVSHFRDHHEKAKAKAVENSVDFLRCLGDRVTRLEKNGRVSENFLSVAQEHPEFSIVLQKAILSAAQTSERSKHDLLARLVTERLQAAPESLVSMVSKMACDAVSYVTPNQLSILGLITNLLYVSPTDRLDAFAAMEWFRSRVTPFLGVNLSELEYTHLESLSCMRFNLFVSRDLAKILLARFGEGFDTDILQTTQFGQLLSRKWCDEHLQQCSLTTLGQLIGVMVNDQRLGGETSLEPWG